MNTNSHQAPLAGRVIAGAMSCALLGFLIEPFGFWSGPHPGPGIRLPVIGPAVGAVIGTVIGLTCGGVTLRGLVKYLAIGVLSGVVIGVLAGILIYAPLMTAQHVAEGDPFFNKTFAGFMQRGILWGIPLGAVCGMAGGFVIHRVRR